MRRLQQVTRWAGIVTLGLAALIVVFVVIALGSGHA
jgi:hypothetical protein